MVAVQNTVVLENAQYIVNLHVMVVEGHVKDAMDVLVVEAVIMDVQGLVIILVKDYVLEMDLNYLYL